MFYNRLFGENNKQELKKMPIDLTTISINIAVLETMGSIVIAGLAIMWVIRKAIKTVNRS